MNRYRVYYRDPDPGCPIFNCVIKAYDKDHLLEKFYFDDDDWVIERIERINKPVQRSQQKKG